MPDSAYASTGGGALKLKGAGIDKKSKKKKKKQSEPAATGTEPDERGVTDRRRALAAEDQIEPETGREDARELSADLKRDLVDLKGKTEAERRHEERKRQRLNERIKREGVKTHKERVEELNQYLSAQSEHHDMPKIGPG